MRSPINPAGVAHYNVPLHDSAAPAARASRPPGLPAAQLGRPAPPAASDMSSSSARRVRKWPGGALGSEGTMCPLRLSAVSPPPPPPNTAPPGGTTTPLRDPPTLQCTRMHPGVGPVRSGAEGGRRKWKQGCRGAGGEGRGRSGLRHLAPDLHPAASDCPPLCGVLGRSPDPLSLHPHSC